MQNIDISELKKKVNSLNEEKEKLYREQTELRKRTREEVDSIKLLKSETDEYNTETTELRNKRDSENKRVRSLIEKIKELREKKKLILKKYDIKDPERVHKKIEELESKIETEALSPSQEKKLMKEINTLKNIFGKDSELERVMKEIKEVSKMLDESKAKGDECHNKLQEIRKKGGYKGFKKISKTITELRKKEKEKTDSLNVIKLHELAKEVEAKLKKKQKITTDDLLAFQAQK